MQPATPLEDARRQILDAVPPLQPIDLPLAESYGCVAAAEVTAEYDIPPFSAAETDGYAARSADVVGATSSAPVTLRVAGRVEPGRPPDVTVGWGESVRVTAGAPLPAGADCVIPPERVATDADAVRVVDAVPAGANVRPAGEDVRAGAVLVPAGRRLSAPELGILATAGHGSVLAYPKVRVAVIALGRLIEPGRPTGFGQVRDAVSYLLLGALRDVGAVPYRIGIVANAERELRGAVMSNALRADAFVVTGGEGERDVPDALVGLGDVRTVRVGVHPGGQVAFGHVEGKPFFNVSGRPVSAFVSFESLVRPAVMRMMGRSDLERPHLKAILDEVPEGPRDVTLLVPVRLTARDGRWHCLPTGPAAESRLGSVVRANALLTVPPGDPPAPGSEVRVQVLRPLQR
ncbi:MAG TPA: gephyrin-like molybdotransferase Glp [Actinomycetota bacterium]|nr:gephyrin-like molybdotransferase Glp [Actinomycetota bacterium]